MVILGIDNEKELLKWKELLIDIPNHAFIEPDLDNQITALAALPVDIKIFRSLRLL